MHFKPGIRSTGIDTNILRYTLIHPLVIMCINTNIICKVTLRAHRRCSTQCHNKFQYAGRGRMPGSTFRTHTALAANITAIMPIPVPSQQRLSSHCWEVFVQRSGDLYYGPPFACIYLQAALDDGVQQVLLLCSPHVHIGREPDLHSSNSPVKCSWQSDAETHIQASSLHVSMVGDMGVPVLHAGHNPDLLMVWRLCLCKGGRVCYGGPGREGVTVLPGALATYAPQQQQAKCPHILGRMGFVAALVDPRLSQLGSFQASATPAHAAHLLTTASLPMTISMGGKLTGPPDWDSTTIKSSLNACISE